MTRFVDAYLPVELPGFGWLSSPRFSTRIVQVDSGAEQVDERWEEPLRRFTLPEAIRQDHAVFAAVQNAFLVLRGPGRTFPMRDPLDFGSLELDAPDTAPAITGMDQQIGIGDGATTDFQLIKTRTFGGLTCTRRIHLPIVASVLVTVDGTDPEAASPPTNAWSVSRPGGVVTFDTPPGIGDIVRAGFLFDCEVRFEGDDSLDGIVKSYQLAGVADLTLVEVRSC